MFGKHEVLIAKGELTRLVLLLTALVRQEAPRRNRGIAAINHEPTWLKAVPSNFSEFLGDYDEIDSKHFMFSGYGQHVWFGFQQ
jgi:hypothetical protein